MIESQRYTLTVPHVYSLPVRTKDMHHSVRATLTRKFGGWTALAAEGEWQGIPDRSTVYIVDVPFGHPTAYESLYSLARRVARVLEQECVYLTRTGNGKHEVECIEP